MKNSKNKIPEKATIKSIAKIAKVSPSTVSRALRNHPGASEKTIKKIKKIAKRINYYPDATAKSLRANKSNTIGVIFNDMNNPFYNDVLWSIYDKLNQLNYSMIVTYSNWDLDHERKNVINLISRRVDGIIMAPINEDDNEIIELLKQKNIKTVFVDTCPAREDVCFSGSDHQEAIYLATKHLMENGHKEILFYSAMPLNSYAKEFIKGYLKAIKEKGIILNKDLVVTLPDMKFDTSYRIFKEILSKCDGGKSLNFTAVVTIGDIFAISIYKAATEMGFSIPENFSITSYDNIEFVSALNPPLTTVNQSRKEIGENAVNILINNLKQDKKNVVKKFTKPYLVIRKSVKNI